VSVGGIWMKWRKMRKIWRNFVYDTLQIMTKNRLREVIFLLKSLTIKKSLYLCGMKVAKLLVSNYGNDNETLFFHKLELLAIL
jgi:hypothetical protein